MAVRKVMLTTTDNPYDPFEDFPSWLAFDSRSGYHSSGMVARIANFSNELSEAQQQFAIEKAIDEIVEINALGVWKKVVKYVDE